MDSNTQQLIMDIMDGNPGAFTILKELGRVDELFYY
jgi:hypothetical protein